MEELPKAAGVYQLQLQPNGHRVTLSIPETYSPEAATPLVIALHWGGPMRPFKGESILVKLVKPALAALNAIIVAPDDETEGWDNPQGEAAILELVSQLRVHYQLDDKRTLLMGFSRGGRGTSYIAARNPKQFAAALVMSANPLSNIGSFNGSTPLYVIHSRDDEEFPCAEVEAAVRVLQTKGAPIELAILEGITHLETSRFVEPLRAALPWIHNAWHS